MQCSTCNANILYDLLNKLDEAYFNWIMNRCFFDLHSHFQKQLISFLTSW